MRARIAREDGIAFRREQVVGIGEGGRSLTLLGGGELHADLLVLAGGAGFSLRSLCAPAELAACTERHRVGLTYRSVLLEGEAFAGESFRQYYYQLSPPGEAMGGVICPVEGGRAVATIVEHGAEERGRADYRAFLAKAALIPGGRFRALLERARPLGEPAVFHKEETFRRRLHELPGFPERVFCVGDIVGSLNPVYGQGMTMALLGASLLEQALRSGATSSRAFHRRLSARLRVPFLLSRVGFAEGPGQRYLQSFLSRCVRSERRHARFLEVMHLRRSPLLLADLPSALAALPGRLS